MVAQKTVAIGEFFVRMISEFCIKLFNGKVFEEETERWKKWFPRPKLQGTFRETEKNAY